MTGNEQRNWTPAGTSSKLALTVALGMVGLLVWQVPETLVPILLGSIGAVSLTLALWLVTDEGDATASFLASLLTIPVALGLVGASVVMLMLLVSEIFPVANPSLLGYGLLLVLSHVGIVVGCSLAVLGVSLGIRNVAKTESLSQYTNIAFVTAIVPGLVGVAFAAGAFFGDGGGPGILVGQVGGLLAELALSTSPEYLELGSFLLVVAFAAGSIRLGTAVLPISQIFAEETERLRRLEKVESWLTGLAVVTLCLGGLVFIFEVVTPPENVQGLVGLALFDLIRVVTTSVLLRFLFFSVTVVVLVATAVGYSARRLAQVSSGKLTRRLTAIGTGVLITLVAISIAEPVYSTIVTEIATRLPDLVAGGFTDRTDLIAEEYGESTIVVLLATFLIGFSGMNLLGLRLVLYLGYLSQETTGYSLASLGLFVATMFAAVIGAPTWLVFVGIVASLFVWDAGHFSTTLGREIGRQASTRRTELVHVVATTLVGTLAALVAFGAASLLDGGITTVADPAESLLALVSLAVGLLALVEALRVASLD